MAAREPVGVVPKSRTVMRVGLDCEIADGASWSRHSSVERKSANASAQDCEAGACNPVYLIPELTCLLSQTGWSHSQQHLSAGLQLQILALAGKDREGRWGGEAP